LQLLEACDEGIIVVDLQGRIRFRNPEADRLVDSAKVAIADLIGDVLSRIDELRSICRHDPLRRKVIHLHDLKASRFTEIRSWHKGDGEMELTVVPLMNERAQLESVAIRISEPELWSSRWNTLLHQATHDALTGLDNRWVFMKRLGRLAQPARAGNHAVLFMDLDNFKTVNDRCGHPAGDAILIQVARLLRVPLRRRDTLARLGGDEFGLLMECCPPAKAIQTAQLLCKTIRGGDFEWRGQRFPIGISIGVATMASPCGNPEEVLAEADRACYRSKQAGGSCVIPNPCPRALHPAAVPKSAP
jgi:diguanylate cyclase (GGDEF)-like protein